MYRYLRNTHLLLGVFSLLFLLMYGVSAVQMSHNSWFDLKPRVTDARIPIGTGKPARAAAQELMDAHGVSGELADVKATAAGSSFRILRTGTVYDVTYDAATGDALMRVRKATFMGMMNRIHHIGGLWHGSAPVNVWGALVGVVSLFLPILGGTGIYLWFKIYNERAIGSLLLALSLGFGVTLIVLIRTA